MNQNKKFSASKSNDHATVADKLNVDELFVLKTAAVVRGEIAEDVTQYRQTIESHTTRAFHAMYVAAAIFIGALGLLGYQSYLSFARDVASKVDDRVDEYFKANPDIADFKSQNEQLANRLRIINSLNERSVYKQSGIPRELPIEALKYFFDNPYHDGFYDALLLFVEEKSRFDTFYKSQSRVLSSKLADIVSDELRGDKNKIAPEVEHQILSVIQGYRMTDDVSRTIAEAVLCKDYNDDIRASALMSLAKDRVSWPVYQKTISKLQKTDPRFFGTPYCFAIRLRYTDTSLEVDELLGRAKSQESADLEFLLSIISFNVDLPDFKTSRFPEYFIALESAVLKNEMIRVSGVKSANDRWAPSIAWAEIIETSTRFNILFCRDAFTRALLEIIAEEQHENLLMSFSKRIIEPVCNVELRRFVSNINKGQIYRSSSATDIMSGFFLNHSEFGDIYLYKYLGEGEWAVGYTSRGYENIRTVLSIDKNVLRRVYFQLRSGDGGSARRRLPELGEAEIFRFQSATNEKPPAP